MDDSSKAPQSAHRKNEDAHMRKIMLAILWPLFAVIATTLAIGLVLGLIVSINPGLEQVIYENTVGQFVLRALINVAALAVVVLPFFNYLFKKGSSKKEVLGLQRGPQLKDIGLVVLAFGAYLVTSTALVSLAGRVLPFVNLDQPQDLGLNVPDTTAELLVIFILLVLFVPLLEELIFRGFMFKALRERLSFWPTTILVSIVFGIAHGQWNVGIDTFALSLFLCSLREYTGSLWAPVMLHSVKNGLAFMLLFVFPDLISELQ